jgi:hypothetical protein
MNTEQKLHGVHYDYTERLKYVIKTIDKYNEAQVRIIHKYGKPTPEYADMENILVALQAERVLLTQFIESIEDILGYSPSRNYPKE